jgi:selenocysteine lyase/cysteine desulfurase
MTRPYSRRFFLGALGAGSLLPTLGSAATFTFTSVPVVTRELWPWMRAQLVLDPALAWLDTARFGPTLRAVMAQEYRSREAQSLEFHRYQDSALDFITMRQRLTAVAAFLGAAPEDLTFTSGTQEALTLVAQGLDLQPGDEILTTTHDHPAAVYPWLMIAKRRGLKVVQLPQDGVPAAPEAIVARFAAAIGPRTRVLLFSHVQYTDGTVMPARELCALARSKNVFSLVDGAQAAGLLDFRITDLGCDAYATCFHKWLNASAGTGALYVRPDARGRLWPLTVERPTGWDFNDRFGITPPAPDHPFDAWPETQAKYGQASRLRAPSLDGVGIAMELQQAVNRGRIASRQRELASYLRQRLSALPQARIQTPTHPALSQGIISFAVPGRDLARLAVEMAAGDGVVVRHIAHGTAFEALRVSVHAYNEYGEIDRMINALQRRL